MSLSKIFCRLQITKVFVSVFLARQGAIFRGNEKGLVIILIVVINRLQKLIDGWEVIYVSLPHCLC